MRSPRSKPLRPLAVAFAAGLAGVAGLAGPGRAQEAAQQGAVQMREVDIRAFIEDVSNATGRTFIVDPRVTGRVTVVANQPFRDSRAYFDVFLATLRANGFVAVPTASGAFRIVPDEVAAREPSAPGAASDDRYVTRVFSLRHAEAESVANALRPMLSARGQVTANRRGNTLVVVDFGSTVRRVQDVVASLDRDTGETRTVTLTNTGAAEMARVAQTLAGQAGEQGAALQIVPAPSSNSVVLRGDPRVIEQLEATLRDLDARADSRSAVQVIPLRYAVAEELVPVLQQVTASLAAQPGQASEGAQRRANIASHRATNSLIISADPETQENLTRVVRALDLRREQILVEAVIVEVSDTAARELGLQFLATGDGANSVPFLSTSYANAAPNLLAVTGALVLDEGDGDDDSPAMLDLRRAAVNSLIGSSGGLFGVGGQRSDGSILGLIVNALSEDRDSNVLSTPSVLTLDNETAQILAGQQIPVTTGETLGDGNQNPFRTVRREDVGVQLEVRPQISSEGGAIRLQIRQEVSSVFGPITPTSTDLITNRREIETVVQVDAGQIVVLGGLIQEDVSNTEQGVPGLRRAPVVGRLFRNEERSVRRTNLMVFLRPTIVTTPEQAREVTQRQYQAVQGFQGLDPAIARRLEEQYFGRAPATDATPPRTP